MTVPTNKDLQDAFMEGFCYAEDVGHTTGKKLAEQAAKRYPVEAKAEAGAQKAVEDADAALRQSDPHVIPPEDDNCEPPEPDLMGHDYREDIRR